MRTRSLVAGANALMRAAESKRSNGQRILDDPFAHRFAERDTRVSVLRYGRFAVPPLWRLIDSLQTVHCVRHRSIDVLLAEAIAVGYRQVVIAGSGYDSRPLRMGPTHAGVRWFELDSPDTGARKRELLAAAGLELPAVQLAIDLDHQVPSDVLAGTPFDPAEPSCFILEGLLHYLPQPALDALLRDLGRIPQCRVLSSFIRTEVYESASTMFVAIVKQLREVPRRHFTRDGMREAWEAAGFTHFESWSFPEQVARFSPEAEGRRHGVSQDVALAERTP